MVSMDMNGTSRFISYLSTGFADVQRHRRLEMVSGSTAQRTARPNYSVAAAVHEPR